MKKLFTLFSLMSLIFLTTGCEKPPVTIVSAQVIDNKKDRSGNFNRLLEICFKEPLSREYYHEVTILTHQGYKVQGSNTLPPLDSKCQLRNIYSYINASSPVGARSLSDLTPKTHIYGNQMKCLAIFININKNLPVFLRSNSSHFLF